MNEKVKTNISEEEIVLAPPTELFDEAKEIAQNTIAEEKFPFALQYDANQKEFLLSLLQIVGAIVEDDDEESHVLATMMNMTQLAFIKRLDCVERVKTDEGINPFLAEEAVKLTPVQQNQQEDESLDGEAQEVIADIDNETLEVQTELAINRTTDANLEAVVVADADQENDGIAVASVAATATSSCSSCSCPTNISMETAATISDESYTSGYICCPGTEQWFKFVATRTGQYTICTTGNLDTVGTLYDCCGDLITSVDDYAPCGKINFRIICNLTAGNTYYVKVGVYGDDIGSYTLRVTERVFANYVTINKNAITLEKGVTYELPITPNYTYKGYNGAQRISGLSVSIDPSNANEQKIWWWEQYGDVLECSYGWDNDGDRYIHVTATGNGTAKLYAEDWNENGKRDECTAYVGGAPVTGITLDRNTLTLSPGESELLYESFSPSNALNQNVSWYSSDENVAEVDEEGWVTAIAAGKVNITVTTEDGGHTATCVVTVDSRPHVTIEEDIEEGGGYDYFNVTFPESEGNLVWKSVGMELEGTSSNIYQHQWNRYEFNKTRTFNEKQLAFLYLLDPFGVTYYIKNNIFHRFSGDSDYKMYQTCMFKDRVYTEIFGTYPRLIKVFPDNTASYFVYNPNISQTTRLEYYTDAEVLFGGHKIYDWLAVADLVINYGVPIVTSLLTTISPTLSDVLTVVELCNVAFFSAAVDNTLSSGVSSGIDAYLQGFIKEKDPNNPDDTDYREAFSKAFGWLMFALDSVVTIIEGLGVFDPSLSDIYTYEKVNSHVDYRVTIGNEGASLTMQELIDYSKQ